MSVGHAHRYTKHPEQLLVTVKHLLATGGASELMRRWQKVDFDHDIVYTCGYNVLGTTRFCDRDFAHALYDQSYAKHLLGAPIDTGLSPDDTLECVLWHEAVEKVIIDADNPINYYDEHDSPGGFGAHEYATVAEHQKVREKGGDPARYEHGLARIIKFCMLKHLTRVPADYACAPLLDDPDEHEQQIIKRLQELGVADAFKTTKEKVKYSPAGKMKTRCDNCSHWQNQISGHGLSTCQLIDGLVRDRYWCKKYEAANAGGNQAGGDLAPAGADGGPDQNGPGAQASAAGGGSQGLQQGPPGRG